MPNDRNNKQNENQSTSDTPTSPSPFETPKGQTLIEPPETEKPRTKADFKINVTQPNGVPMTIRTWAPIILSILTLFVIAFQAYIYKRQWEVMKINTRIVSRQTDIMDKQADISSKQMINGERAWITVDNLESKEVKEQVPRSVIITIVNSGNSPALNTIMLTTWGVKESELIPMPDIDETSEPTAAHVVIGARSAKRQNAQPFNLSDEQVRLINQQTHSLYVWGIVRYEDIFGQGHITKFCEVYDMTKPEWKYCQDTNTAD